MSAKGIIVLCNENKRIKTREGETAKIYTRIKNIGNNTDDFRLYLFDGNTKKEILHEPNTSWITLNPGQTKEVLLSIPKISTANSHLLVELRKQSTPYTADDTKSLSIWWFPFVMIFMWVGLPRIVLWTPFPRVACWNKEIPEAEIIFECPFIRYLMIKKITGFRWIR